MAQLGERVAGIEGILGQISERLSHIEIRLMDFERNKADKWEIRLWFLLIVLLMTVYQFLD